MSTIEVYIHLDNTDQPTAFQFDLTAPAGFKWGTEFTKSERLGDSHTVAVRALSDNQIRIIGYATDNTPIRGNAGALGYVSLTIANDAEEGAEYDLTMSGATLGTADMEDVLTEAPGGKVIIQEMPDLEVSEVTTPATSVDPGDELSVSWKVSNIGTRTYRGGWGETVKAVDADGRTTMLYSGFADVEGLSGKSTVTREAKGTVTALPGIDGDVRLIVEVTPGVDSGESQSSSANNSATSDGTVWLGKHLVMTSGATTVAEDGKRVECTLTRTGSWAEQQTFTLTSSDSGRLACQESVTINASNSSAKFYVTPVDNNLLDGDATVTVTASGNDYEPAEVAITVTDNEKPEFGITITFESVTEGKNFPLKIDLGCELETATTVNLATDMPNRMELPGSVEIPAETASVTLAIPTTDNPDMTGDVTATVIATTERYGSSSDMITIVDKDMPALTVLLSTDVLYQGNEEGNFFVTVSRSTNTDPAIEIELSDNSDGLLIYEQRIVEMAAGVTEVTIPLFVADDVITGGSKECEMTAAIVLKSCSCSAPAGSAGSVTVPVTIIDPTRKRLTLLCQNVLTSRTRKRQITVTRNIDTSNPLTVSLSANTPVTVPPSVTIPAGEKSATFEAALDEAFTEGTGIAIATAEAAGYTRGNCLVPYSAEQLPDASIAMKLSGDKLTAGGKVSLTVTIRNNGDAPLSSDAAVTIASKGFKAPVAFTLDKDLEPGESVTKEATVNLIDAVATFNIVGTVNASRVIKEATYTNNSAYVKCSTEAPFTVTASADKKLYMPGETITITGKAQGGDVANRSITLYLIANSGGINSTNVTTDSEGAFRYETVAKHTGRIRVVAGYDGDIPQTPQAEYDVAGMTVETRYVTCNLRQGEPLEGKIEIYNPMSIDLTGVKIAVETDLDDTGIALQLGDAGTIAAEKMLKIPFTITGNELTDADGYTNIELSITSDQQATGKVTIKYRVLPQLGRIEADVEEIEIAVLTGEPRDYTINIINTGAGETGGITLSLPKEVKSLTPVNLVSLKPGESTAVNLRFEPTDNPEEVLKTKGNIAINCAQGIGVSIPFTVTHVATETGKLKLIITDEYAYYDTAGERIETDNVFDRTGVAGASVELVSLLTNETVVSATTDQKGVVDAELLAGHYRLMVSSANHSSVDDIIYIEPGTDNELEAFCSYDAITYEWQVTETEVEDSYEMKTLARFTTMVPKPVVTIDYPEEGVPILQPFTITVTNHGLIRAFDVDAQLNVEGDFTVVPLSDTNIETLEAGEVKELEVVLIPNDLLKDSEVLPMVQSRGAVDVLDEMNRSFDWVAFLTDIVASGVLEDIQEKWENLKWWTYCYVFETKLALKYFGCRVIEAEERKLYAKINSECHDNTTTSIKDEILKIVHPARFFVVENPKRRRKPYQFVPNGGTPGGLGSSLDLLPRNIGVISGPCDKKNKPSQASVKNFVRVMEHLGVPQVKATPDNADDATCATIMLEFKQDIALTRQAFRGSLTILNGMPVDMTGIKVLLTVTDDQGVPVTSHIIDMSTEGTEGFSTGSDETWTVAAGGTATANYLFIPTVAAAPEEPKDYSFGGYLTFNDPETGTPKTLPLQAVTMTVVPTPEFELTYFMQRDVIGDDPLTTEVETTVPAEFSLLVNNVGNGEAKNMKITTAQPEIVENEKGLKITYSIVSAQLNGADHNLALGQSITTDFGGLPAHSTAFAQWWMESSLLGHFVDYDFSVNHLTSHDNPSLSLIREASLHELIRGLRFEDADGKPQRAFLVNDMADDESYPDMAYLTDGSIWGVHHAMDAQIEEAGDSQYELTVAWPTRDNQGAWIYGNVADPTSGLRKIVSVRRMSDGREIDPYNFWLTDRTLYDYKKPVYENRLHFGDFTAAGGSEKYLITFAERHTKELDVTHISAGISDFSATDKPVDEIVVNFNKDVKVSSIKPNDNIKLSLDGKPLTITPEMITAGDDYVTIKPSTITEAPGFYQLAVDCSRIQDTEGYAGSSKRFFSWTKDKTTDITDIGAEQDTEGPAYDLLGRPVDGSYRGITIRKGVKSIEAGKLREGN